MTKSASESPQNELQPVRGSGKPENVSEAPHGSGNATLASPDRIWLTEFTDNRDPRFVMLDWNTPEARSTQPGDYVAIRPHRKIEYVPVEQSQITVAQVRAALLDVIDQGYQCQLADGLQRGELSECNLWHPWRFDFGWPETDEENQRRVEFADRVIQRLTELRERGLG